MRATALLVVCVLLPFIDPGYCAIGDDIHNEDEDKPQGCTGSIKILDKDDKQLIVVSDKHPPEKRLEYDGKSNIGKAIMEGSCCFEARQKPVGKPGGSALFTENKEYPLSFKVNYVIKSECVSGASTSWIPILITLAVIAVLATVAAVVYMKKRNRGMTPVSSQP